MDAPPTRAEQLTSLALTLRRLRWACAALAAPLLGFYRSPETVEVPHPVRPWAVVIVAWLVVTNLASRRISTTRDARRLERAAIGEVAADSVLALGIIALMSFDQVGAEWGLLSIVALEAALRLRVAHLVTTLVANTSIYLAIQLWAASNYGIAHRWNIASFRMAMVIGAAAVGGGLARQLREHLGAARRARDEADERARLLRVAADAGRSLAVLGTAEVLDSVVDAAMRLGFDAVDVCALDEAAGVWRLERALNLPADYVARGQHEDSGVSAMVRRVGRTVVIDDYAGWEGALPEVRASGFTTVVGVPVRVGGRVVATLGVGTRRPRPVSAAELECLDLLAAQASAAFDAASRQSEARGLHEQLAHSTSHDRLTGLPNRDVLLDRLASLLRRVREEPDVAVVVCDVDGFREVNDDLGHRAGDQLLLAVADRLKASANERLVARMAGDEFAIVVERGGVEAAMRLARLLQVDFRAPVVIEGNEIVVSLSVGVAAEGQSPHADGPSLLRDAGLALERAKHDGRGRSELYDPSLRGRARRRLAAETELRQALAAGAITAVYQPVVSLETGAILAVEALARWTHPGRGPVPPAEFVPLAEATGLIQDLGHRMLELACRQAREWQELECPPLRVSVNVSAMQLQADGFVASVGAVLEATGLDPDRLVLELTESAVLDDEPAVLSAVQALAGLGVALAIDDLGRGWSSLAYIARFPLAELKIDGSFVDGMVRRRADRAIVRSLVGLAHDLGLRVVAEGVEDGDQLAELARLGCDAAQGFHLHRPMPAAGVTELVAAASRRAGGCADARRARSRPLPAPR